MLAQGHSICVKWNLPVEGVGFGNEQIGTVGGLDEHRNLFGTAGIAEPPLLTWHRSA
jgi:hypothetical protein